MNDTHTNSDKTPVPKPLSGIWRSTYAYVSNSKGTANESTHYMRMHPKGGELVIESIPAINDSYLVARFWVDGEVATGSWQEVTSPNGEYEGAIYHGAAQVMIAKDRKRMEGKWIGFNKKMEVTTGPWTLTYLGEDIDVVERDKKSLEK